MSNSGILRNLRIKRVALVDMGANFDKATGDGAHVMLYKRADVKKDSPSVSSVHVDAIIGGKKKKEKDVNKSILKRLFGVASETDVEKRKAEMAKVEEEIDNLPDDPVIKVETTDVEKAVKTATAELEKRHKDEIEKLEKQNKDAIAAIDVEKGLRLDREMSDVLKGFKFVPVDPKADVAKFRKMKETAPEEYARAIELLTATDALLAKSALFTGFGTDITGGNGGAWSQIEAKADALVSKDAKMTREMAIEKVMLDPENKALVAEYRKNS